MTLGKAWPPQSLTGASGQHFHRPGWGRRPGSCRGRQIAPQNDRLALLATSRVAEWRGVLIKTPWGREGVTSEACPLPPPALQGASHPCWQEKSFKKTLDHRNVNP